MDEPPVSKTLRAEARRVLRDESRSKAERAEVSGRLFLAATWIEAVAADDRRIARQRALERTE